MGRYVANCKVLCKYVVVLHWGHVKLWDLGMDNLQIKLAVIGLGLVKWYFKIHFQVYLSLWHEWPAFIISTEMCSRGLLQWLCYIPGFTSWNLFAPTPFLFSIMNLLFQAGLAVRLHTKAQPCSEAFHSLLSSFPANFVPLCSDHWNFFFKVV